MNLERSNSEGVESVSTQDKWLIWGKIVNDWEEYSKKKSKALKVSGITGMQYVVPIKEPLR